jgi:hypothetical protein
MLYLSKSDQHLINFLGQCILVFDEAHNLAQMNSEDTWSAFSKLQRALQSLQHLPIFSVFLSTSGKMSQFTPLPSDDVSNCVA